MTVPPSYLWTLSQGDRSSPKTSVRAILRGFLPLGGGAIRSLAEFTFQTGRPPKNAKWQNYIAEIEF